MSRLPQNPYDNHYPDLWDGPDGSYLVRLNPRDPAFWRSPMKTKKFRVTKKHLKQVVQKGNWIVRTDMDGESHGGFKWPDIGEWVEAPDWNEDPICEGGLFGQDGNHFGFCKRGTRFVFCETEGPHIAVDGEKVKVRRARILLINEFPPNFNFGGTLDLSGATLPEGFTIGDVGGSLDLSGATLPEGFVIGNVGGWLDLSGVTLPEGFTIGDVGGALYLRGATLPEGFTMPKVKGRIYQ